MTDFVRRLVSGNKARFRDGDLDLELDLAYITDRVIVMGYPAEGLEGLYRNRREDAKKFLEHRHGKDYWVFNFCPVKENLYPASVFDGRVSRYPFPDHHAPPLAILPLVAREMRLWLDGSSERVAVLHCKAGKGRSGTLACAYLLSLDDAPSPPRLERSLTKSERAKSRAEALMNTMPADDAPGSGVESQAERRLSEEDPVKQELSREKGKETDTPATEATSLERVSSSNSLSHVLELHTSRRMKRPSSPAEKIKQGVSIPSQRRWLYYWSLLLAHQEPVGFWAPHNTEPSQTSSQVRLTEIKIRMHELSGIKSNLLKAANVVMDKANLGKGTHLRTNSLVGGKKGGQVWVSLGRYDDELVDTLETWEKRTRSEDGKLGKRKPGSDDQEGERLDKLFDDTKWDQDKMVRSFARFGMKGDALVETNEGDKGEKVLTHELTPLGGESWNLLRRSIEQNGADANSDDGVASEETSLYEVAGTLSPKDGVVLDSNREVRAKLYYGQVFMGWFWFIPSFHIPPRESSAPHQPVSFKLTRKEVDFPLGVGSFLIDVEVVMEWCQTDEALKIPQRNDSLAYYGEPTGIGATLQALTAESIDEMVEAKQAAED